ncbi:MAG: YggS family pyridoxal phosphate-dependent enzyme [Gammaproteobacteria bacterium]|nr:YggS family pyridoxal phosphate-dependent enzyme [Gammaproteobacteria bacterium]
MTQISENLSAIRQRIQETAQKFHRDPQTIKLLTASKARSIAEIQEAVGLGQYIFGENYVQEALSKIEALSDSRIEWHFIGPIQSNKTKTIAEHFAWAQSIDRLKIAQRLSAQRPENLPPLNVCIEVNLSKESTKSGVSDEGELIRLAEAISALPNLKLRGLMAIPEPSSTFDKQRKIFRKLVDYLKILNDRGLNLDTLSMGMSDDFEAAIAEGATIIRLGTAIFGPREKIIKH